MRLLVIEDNIVLAWRLRAFFEKKFDVNVAHSGTEGIRMAETGRYDLITLDLGLPDIGGDKVCKTLRDSGVTTPILVLSGEGMVQTKVNLLGKGADDYLTKPFDLTELQARVQALLRRRQIDHTPNSLLKVGSLLINREQRTVERDGKVIQLRRKEFELLEYLARNQDKIVTPTMILNNVWGDTTTETWNNTVRVHIKYLRDKIDKPFNKPLIKTARGVGYVLKVP